MPSIVRRPWFLTIALALLIVQGSCHAYSGFRTISFYHQAEVQEAEEVGDDALRVALAKAEGLLVNAMHEERGRLFPLAILEFLLGCGAVAFALRTAAGRELSRRVLLQFVAALLALSIASYGLTPRYRAAIVEAQMLAESALGKPSNGRLLRIAQGIVFATQASIWLFGLVALTRGRAKEYCAVAVRDEGDDA